MFSSFWIAFQLPIMSSFAFGFLIILDFSNVVNLFWNSFCSFVSFGAYMLTMISTSVGSWILVHMILP